MPLPVMTLSAVTLGAAAVFGVTEYVRARRAIKKGEDENTAFADSTTDPVGPEMESPYKRDKAQNPPKAPEEPKRMANAKSANTNTPRKSGPKVTENA